MDANTVMQSPVLFKIRLFGADIPVSNSIVMMWIIMAVLIVLSLIFVRDLKTVPRGKQNVVETVVEGITKILTGTMGKHARTFVPYFGTILLFLVFANISGIFSLIPSGEQLVQITGNQSFAAFKFSISPPTKDLNITLAMAVMSVFLVLFCGIRYRGVKGWLHSFLEPLPVMLPFHILDYATRILSLSLRLFGNILAGFIIMEMLYMGALYVKPFVPLASAFFDLFDAGLQAYIFVFLSSIYISEAIE